MFAQAHFSGARRWSFIPAAQIPETTTEINMDSLNQSLAVSGERASDPVKKPASKPMDPQGPRGGSFGYVTSEKLAARQKVLAKLDAALDEEAALFYAAQGGIGDKKSGVLSEELAAFQKKEDLRYRRQPSEQMESDPVSARKPMSRLHFPLPLAEMNLSPRGRPFSLFYAEGVAYVRDEDDYSKSFDLTPEHIKQWNDFAARVAEDFASKRKRRE